jgi:hypothetical protein
LRTLAISVVVVQGKCQGLLFSNYVSISPQRMNFYHYNKDLPSIVEAR